EEPHRAGAGDEPPAGGRRAHRGDGPHELPVTGQEQLPPTGRDGSDVPPKRPDGADAAPGRTDDRPRVWPPLPAAGHPAGTVAGVSPSTTGAARGADAPTEHTSELPQLTAPAGVPALTVAEETVELPIFRELESVWFRSHADGPDSGPATPVPAAAPRPSGEREPAYAQARETATATTATATTSATATTTATDGGAVSWRTAADDGWHTAAAVAEPPVREKTQAGLPRRTPMAQLVPGGVDSENTSVQRRTPEGVRGLLAAYHRGVQRGRSKPTDEATPGRPYPPAVPQQSATSGKERDA
ncbi:MAG TPA: hypothetical protein VFY17_00175, partial [Pilimelia sp.]|nr:hypothetical protein [Pilimelia sp.]